MRAQKLKPKTIFIYQAKQKDRRSGETEPTTTTINTTIPTDIFVWSK